MRKVFNKISDKATEIYTKVYAKLKDNTGADYVDTGVKILIAVVIGALLLGGLYAVFNETVLPTLKSRIQDMFDYAG